MSIINKYFIWISAEGLTGLSNAKCESIKAYDVTLFPDAGCYDKWSEKALEYDFKISRECERWLADGHINKGDDIADYFLKNYSELELKVLHPVESSFISLMHQRQVEINPKPSTVKGLKTL